MKSNPLLKWLLIPMGLLLVFVGIKLFSGERGAKPAPAGAASQLTPEEMKAMVTRELDKWVQVVADAKIPKQ